MRRPWYRVHTGPVEAARDGGAGQDAAGHDGHTLVGASAPRRTYGCVATKS
ncbi:hypothetical protein ACH4EC_22355 [Streptomyces anulatus]